MSDTMQTICPGVGTFKMQPERKSDLPIAQKTLLETVRRALLMVVKGIEVYLGKA